MDMHFLRNVKVKDFEGQYIGKFYRGNRGLNKVWLWKLPIAVRYARMGLVYH